MKLLIEAALFLYFIIKIGFIKTEPYGTLDLSSMQTSNSWKASMPSQESSTMQSGDPLKYLINSHCKVTTKHSQSFDFDEDGPIDKKTQDEIYAFIDDNKSLMKRMYGPNLQIPNLNRCEKRSSTRVFRKSNIISSSYITYGEWGPTHKMTKISEGMIRRKNGRRRRRRKRQNIPNDDVDNNEDDDDDNKVNVCPSKISVLSPNIRKNRDGVKLVLVNNELIPLKISVEECRKNEPSARCRGECSCKQRNQVHRLMAYDPNNKCKGIFMDWFEFPAGCICQCKKNPFFDQ